MGLNIKIMYRYIKTNNQDDFRKYLKTYLGDDLTNQDIEDMVNDAFPQNTESETLLSPELKKQIHSEFSKQDADNICRLVELGYSVDNAIQTVLAQYP